ncbi:ATP synthase delta (OSCP) subunit family protein [Candida albicans]|uniref:ATP synthase subunit 5, mitochondrial n=1 Tax=Candida albicans TaxID=5476 RepID=A0A8H6C598_CANAX|nr:ATP synthase delta (OSCP) subunit family protein [Candida albicans]
MISRVFSRSLASAAKSTKPPIQLFGIDGTYANALYSATIQQSDMAQTYKSLEKIENVIKGDPQLKNALTNPSLTKDDRVAIAKSVANDLSLDKTTANFLTVLAENNRLGNFSTKVTSAKPLESKILKRLQTSIGKSSFVGEGKTLKLTNQVNPEILGGLVVEVGDRTVDVSIANKVARLNQTLRDNL